jgi:hypothetical protein
MNSEQQKYVQYVLEEFLNIHTADIVDTQRYRNSLKDAKIAWFGEKTGIDVPSYLRVESPEFLIEILQTSNYSTNPKSYKKGEVANHIHSVFRDIKNDFDYDVLGNHQIQSHTHKH